MANKNPCGIDHVFLSKRKFRAEINKFCFVRGISVKNLSGMKMKFTVLKNEDIEKYVPQFMVKTLEDISKHIEDGRIKDGKSPNNTYIVINVDEPYAQEVIDILKRHGHWG
jgi:hypothetical protein